METIKEQRSVSKQIILCLLTYLTSIVATMCAGFSAVALPALLSDKNPYRLTPSQASWFASILTLATLVGCFIAGPISDRYGRKRAIVIVNFITFVGWVFISFAYEFSTHQFSVLILGRIFTGISCGMATTSPVVYVTEISSTKLRLMLTTAIGIFFALGMLGVYILGWIFEDNWGRISTIIAVSSIIVMTLAQIFLPESPTWLVGKGRIEKASISMCKIYGYKDQNDEVFEDIQALINNRDASKTTSTKQKTLLTSMKRKIYFLRKPSCFKPFILIITYFFFQQFSGIVVIIFYAIDIVKAADVTIDRYKAIVLIALTRLIASILVTYLSRKCGRRPLSILSGAGITICMMILSLYLYLKEIEAFKGTSYSWIPIFALILHFFMSTLGFLTIPFAMSAECFPAKIRGTASGLITCIAHIFLFIAVKMFPAMLEGMMPHGLFFFYGIISLIGTIFVIALLPETKGKTLDEIQEHFVNKKRKNIISREAPDVKVLCKAPDMKVGL